MLCYSFVKNICVKVVKHICEEVGVFLHGRMDKNYAVAGVSSRQ